MFYNTNDTRQPELALAWKRTENQKEIVKKIFACNVAGLTPYEAWIKYESIGYKAPQTSIRRAICDLTEEGYLTMTTEKRLGQYNSMNYVWCLKK